MDRASARRPVTAGCAVALALALLLCATPVARASSAPPTPTSGPPPDLRVGFLQTVQSLNPFVGYNEASMVLYSLLYDFPFSFDPDGNYVSNLVTGASCAVANCSVWNYTVRQGVHWSDGTGLTAADVNFTWNYDSQDVYHLWAFEPYFDHVVVCTSTNRPACGAVLSATNPWNVTLYFDRPFVAGRDLLAPIIQQRQWSSVSPQAAETSFANPVPVGTGPFIADPNLYTELLASQTTTTPLHLLRNPNYHAVGGATPSTAIEDLYLYTYSDPTAMATALEAGTLDLAQFTSSTIGPVRGAPNVQVQSSLEAIRTWNYVGISQCDTPMADGLLNPARFDVNVRQALAHATDKDAIVQTIYGGQGVRGDSLLSPIAPAWWYDPVAGGDNLTFDIAQANAILNQSGYTTWSGGSFGSGVRSATNAISVSIQSSENAFRVEDIANTTKTIAAGTELTFALAVRPPSVFPEEYTSALYLQQEWSKIGVQVTIKVEPTEAGLASDVYGCKVETYIWFWSSDPDPNYMLSMQSSWMVDGWNDNLWVNTSYNRRYLAQLGDQSLPQREADALAAEKLQYDQAADLIYIYPYGEWAMRTDLWQGWGDWAAHPYLQMNVPWGANPLWFNVTCPSCTPVSPPPAPTSPSLTPSGSVSVFAGTEVALTSTSSDADPAVQLNFTSDWGDGTATNVVTSSASPSATASHAWLATGTFQVNVLVYDGYNAPVWSSAPLTVHVVTPTSVGYLGGTVTGSSGGALAGATILAAPGNWVTSTETSGAYNLSLPAGTYSVTASAPFAASASAANVPVLAGGVTTLNFVLSMDVGWLAGGVFDAATGSPLAGAQLVATSSTGTEAAVSSDADGLFNLTLAPGAYSVIVSASGYASASQTGVLVTSGQATGLVLFLVPLVNPIHLALASAIGRPGQAIALAGNVTAPGPGTWTLDFGDGTNVTGVHGAGTTAVAVNHTYAAQGSYTVRLSAASLLVSAEVTATAVVDGTPPLTTPAFAGTAGTAPWFRSDVTVTLQASDPLSGVVGTWYRLDGGAMQAYPGSFTVSGEGMHTLQYYSEDRVGNVEATHTTSIGIDTTPPSVQIMSPAESAVLSSSSVTVSWTGSDAGSGIARYEIRVDGGAPQAVGTNTLSSIGLPDGTHTISVWAVDAAGNNAYASVTVRVDTNLFSPSGPYAGAPTYAILAVVAAVSIALVLLRRRRGRQTPPTPPPPPAS